MKGLLGQGCHLSMLTVTRVNASSTTIPVRGLEGATHTISDMLVELTASMMMRTGGTSLTTGGSFAPAIAFATPFAAATLPIPLLRQLLRMPLFTQERHETAEAFVEWYEHFANLGGWDDNWRLMYLTSSLWDTAASFYRSCNVDVRSNYQSLVAVTYEATVYSVHLTAVKTQLFHNGKDS